MASHAASPSSPSRSAFREDGVLFDVNSYLARSQGIVNALDLGCEDGRLARTLLAARPSRRVAYSGIDSNLNRVKALQNEKRSGAFAALDSFNCTTR